MFADSGVLAHGGGGTEFEWVRMWNRRGSAATAMDTVGSVPERAEGGAELSAEMDRSATVSFFLFLCRAVFCGPPSKASDGFHHWGGVCEPTPTGVGGVKEIDDLNRAGEVRAGKIPYPVGPVADDFLLGAAPTPLPGSQVEALAELFGCFHRAHVKWANRGLR